MHTLQTNHFDFAKLSELDIQWSRFPLYWMAKLSESQRKMFIRYGLATFPLVCYLRNCRLHSGNRKATRSLCSRCRMLMGSKAVCLGLKGKTVQDKCIRKRLASGERYGMLLHMKRDDFLICGFLDVIIFGFRISSRALNDREKSVLSLVESMYFTITGAWFIPKFCLIHSN